MKLESMSFFSLASKRMEWLSSRQKVIAENVANADTPGYKARDISGFQEMLQQAAPVSSGVAVTRTGHIRSTGDTAPGVRVETDEGAWQNSLDGNSVVLEQQTIKATEVAENYKLAASLYRKGYELLTLSVTGIR